MVFGSKKFLACRADVELSVPYQSTATVVPLQQYYFPERIPSRKHLQYTTGIYVSDEAA